jgi:hypothetical protein
MRGQRVRLDEGDGEIDENFWAQAAANAGRQGEDGDEGEFYFPEQNVSLTVCSIQRRRNPVQYTVLPR